MQQFSARRRQLAEPIVWLVTVAVIVGCLGFAAWERAQGPRPVDPAHAMRPAEAESDPFGIRADLRRPPLAAPLIDEATSAPASCSASPSPDLLYLLQPSRGGATLHPLDPSTLADRPGCAWLQGPQFGLTRRSVDGALTASIHSDRGPAGLPYADAMIVVRESVTGEEVSRFVPPGPAGSELRFSAAGDLLLVQGFISGIGGRDVEWYVVDPATGNLLATIPAERGVASQAFFAGGEATLYRLVYRTDMTPGGSYPPRGATARGPWPVELAVHDLAADGAEVARLSLSMVLAGSWWSDRELNGNRIPAELMPGAALSPDRRTLAIAHADADAVTVVDLDRLEIVQTVAIARVPSLAEALLDWLSLAPRPAAAKGMDGNTRYARFAPAGHLLVWGGETSIEAGGRLAESPLPLRLIDVGTGRLIAEALVDSTRPEVLPAADGHTLYVGAPRKPPPAATRPPGAAKPTYVLRRIDMATLTVQAERELVGPFGGMLYGTWEPGLGWGGPLSLD